MKLLFTNWALVLVWCHFVACSNMAIKCSKLINRALVLVWGHFVGGSFEAAFLELGSLVWCHFVACSNIAIKCIKLFVLVWCSGPTFSSVCVFVGALCSRESQSSSGSMPSRSGNQTEDDYGAQYSEDGFLVYDNRQSFEETISGIVLSDSFLMAKEGSEWIVYASQVIDFSG